MFKTITKKIFAFILLSTLVVGTTLARNANDDPANINTVLASDQNYRNWKQSMHIEENDTALSFNIHYYAWDEGAQNMRVHIQNLNNKTFEKGETINVSGWVQADNLSRSNGSATVTFDKKVKLHLFYTSDQKNNCKSRSCEDGSANNVFSSTGHNVGNFPVKNNSNYYGNVVVVYTLEDLEDTPEPIDGGWTNWVRKIESNWGICIDGIKSRTVIYTRSCTNPTPANGGRNCVGDLQKTEVETRSCTVETNEEAEVYTRSATNITADCATLNGEVDLNDESSERVKFRYGTSSSDLDEIVTVRTLYSDDDFSKTICDLDADTKYYFQAYSDSDEGAIKSFRTKDVDEEIIEARVYTNSATNITSNSAQLNGYLDINDTKNARVYFVYGKSIYNLNLKTAESRIINDNTTFQSIIGLKPNTKYYYQAIVKDNNDIVDKGVIKSFITKKSDITITPISGKCGYTLNKCIKGYFTNIKDSTTQYKWRCNGINGGYSTVCRLNKTTKKQNQPQPKPIEVVVVNETTRTVKNYEEKGLKINKWVSTEKFGTYGLSTNAKIGDKVYYKIRVKNNSNKTIENVEVKDFIPAELNWNGNSTENVDKYATYIVNLTPNQSRTIITEMILSDNAEVGEVIDSAAKINMDGVIEDTNSVSITVVDNNLLNNDDNNERNGQTASIFGANSDFFPSSVIGWMILLILALAAGLLITRILTTTAKRD